MKLFLLVLLQTLLVTIHTLHVKYEFGSNISPIVAVRVSKYLDELSLKSNGPNTQAVLLHFGDTNKTEDIISIHELFKLKEESYIIRSKREGGNLHIATNGKAFEPQSFFSPNAHGNIGAHFGVYALLEQALQFSFLHPLMPSIPSEVEINDDLNLNVVSEPLFQFRAHHIHTQHPLELCETLNGFGENMSITDQASFEKSVHQEFENFLEWMIANKQNHFEWVLLSSPIYKEFSESELRKSRLSLLVDTTKSFGINVGIDAALAMQQQNAWTLIREWSSDFSKIMSGLKQRIDYLMSCGFDFVSTEMGTTEFTTGDVELQIRVMNATTEYLYDKYKTRFLTKSHISQGQIIKNYKDPVTNQSGCNFNYLCYYIDDRLGVLPHTVQHFSLNDPSHTYGSKNFTSMLNFMRKVQHKHYTIWYPETAYWVTFDINVPLFLPSYVDRRILDLEIIDSEPNNIKGQSLFSSGWQFGYWLNDVVVARAAWNVKEWNKADHETNLRSRLNQVTIMFGEASGPLNDCLYKLIVMQREFTIFGRTHGQSDIPTRNQTRRSGIAYLEGWDTFADLLSIVDVFGTTLSTQPNKMGYQQVRYGADVLQNLKYVPTIQNLLKAMHEDFGHVALDFKNLLQYKVPKHNSILLQTLIDSAVILSRRASMVYYLYEYSHHVYLGANSTVLQNYADKASSCIKEAEFLANGVLLHSGVPVDRITSWRPNPTVYKFTYLWSAKTLHYWWRDYLMVVKNIKSPCFMNIIDPIETSRGHGIAQNVAEMIRKLADQFGHLEWFADCLAAPKKEPQR
ncbi:hypothetical protein AKO1_005814 [Acrasis kona]|uniref:Uncharacterized protein n=1 Tax=Acrasis kona TaxID=1008807 RepID=A0AAW2YK49_9EUKA